MTTTTTPDDVPAAPGETTVKRRNNLLPAVVVAVGLIAGGFLMGGGSESGAETAGAGDAHEAPEEPEPEPGEVVVLDPITLNLADGRYLKVGLALQLSAEAEIGGGHGGGDGTDPAFTAPALDEAIAVFGNHTSAELAAPGGRDAAKRLLVERLAERYHGDVLDLYFTQFVMQ